MASVTVRRADLYQVLGVTPAASTDEIAAAFRAQAKALHPDRNPGDTVAAERFKDLTLAYQTLVRPRSRDAYDRRHHQPADRRVTQRHATARAPLFRTAGRARAAVVSGIVLVILGIAGAALLLTLDTGDAGETVTLWIAVLKLVICGPVLAAAGILRLRRLATAR